MRVRIDEARCHDATRHVDAAPRRLGDAAHLDDAVADQADIGDEAGRSGAVDHRSAGKDQIEHGASVVGQGPSGPLSGEPGPERPSGAGSQGPSGPWSGELGSACGQ